MDIHRHKYNNTHKHWLTLPEVNNVAIKKIKSLQFVKLDGYYSC